MKRDMEIGAKQVFDCMYYLLQRYPWLGKQNKKLHADAEHEAVTFLLRLAQHDVDTWGDLSEPARETASALVLDFMIKLRQPESRYSTSKWLVNVDSAPWQQALTVIEHEIRRGYPQH